MLPPRLLLLRLIPREPGDRSPNIASNTIPNSLSEIIHLAGCFLAFALFVLADTFLLEAFCAEEAAERFFGGAHVLVPRTAGAVGRVFCDATFGGDREGTGFGGCVREVVLGVCDVFAGFALGLRGILC